MRWLRCFRIIRLDPATGRKLDQISTALAHIQRKLKTMSEQSDALNAKVDALATALTGIRKDITDIKNSLPSGGMTAEDVAALSAKLDTVVTDAQELDTENPATPPAA